MPFQRKIRFKKGEKSLAKGGFDRSRQKAYGVRFAIYATGVF